MLHFTHHITSAIHLLCSALISFQSIADYIHVSIFNINIMFYTHKSHIVRYLCCRQIMRHY